MRATGDAPPALSPWEAGRRSLRSHYYARRHRSPLRALETYCLFVGHARAGGSLLGALLDAHPDAVVADEIDVLAPLRKGWSRDRILAGIIASSRTQARWRHTAPGSGRTLPNAVPDQWQGRFRRLQVVGSSQAGPTTRAIAASPHLLDRWRTTLDPARLRAIQVVRNPYDAIAQMMLRSGRSFDSGIERYFSNCAAVTTVRARLPANDVLIVRYEALVADPIPWLRRCCEHLGLDPAADYLAAVAAAIVELVRHRRVLHWTPEHIADVRRQMTAYDFLFGYDFSEESLGG